VWPDDLLRVSRSQMRGGRGLRKCLPTALLEERRLFDRLLQLVGRRVSGFSLLQLRRCGCVVRERRAVLLPGLDVCPVCDRWGRRLDLQPNLLLLERLRARVLSAAQPRTKPTRLRPLSLMPGRSSGARRSLRGEQR
jgi:hypothetical protein